MTPDSSSPSKVLELKIFVSFDWSVPAKLLEAEVLEFDDMVNLVTVSGFLILCIMIDFFFIMMGFSVPAQILEVDVLVQVLKKMSLPQVL